MIERQDIDALLVSALYGELTPADEARLTTHLESHPGDRSALDDLKVARQAIRDSRIFELQLDPPQAVSALLLQEAARRAPKSAVVRDRSESWFNRFVRSFIAHPAMAAAATLVLVVGVAGTLYVKKGNEQLSDQTVSQNEAPARGAEPAMTPVTSGPSAGSAATGDQGVAVGLADNNAGKGAAQERNDDQPRRPDEDLRKADKVALETERAKAATTTAPTAHTHGAANGSTSDGFDGRFAAPKPTTPSPTPTRGKNEAKSGIAVSTPQPSPKDLDSSRVGQPDPAQTGFAEGVVGGGAPGAGPSGGAATTSPRNQPAPPPPAMTVEKPASKADAKPAKEDQSTSWARDQHQRLLGLVKAGKCQDAAPLAVQIKNKVPDYYNAYVANDRGLKQCMAYISDAAERDAEKSQKSRPAKRVEATDVK